MTLHLDLDRSSRNRLSRREWLRTGTQHALALTLAQSLCSAARPVAAQSKGDAELEMLNRFPRMVQEYYVERVKQVEREADARRDALATRADAEAYVESVRGRILECFGPFPEKTPLNPKITGTVERDAYRIENVIFESRPGFLVTANLYVPKQRNGKAPGVVGSCGHSSNGKAAGAYQSFAQGLARQGYVVLIFDPIGQGERLQYPDEKLHSRVGVGVQEHLYAGNQQFLVGEFLGSWRAWDGIRALDYLLTREEVDPARVGVTGNSGGGTMTTWLCGVEQRWSMAAPSCFVTTFRRNLENELPADTEQCPPLALAKGLDHSDFIAAMAPKPVILLAKERDFFDVRGTIEAYHRLKQLYKLLGAEENIGLFIGPTYHGYSQENREAMYGWFNGVTKVAEGHEEPELTIEKDETLYCAPRGQVSELGSRTVFSFTKEHSQSLAGGRGTVSGEALREAIGARVHVSKGEKSEAPRVRILRNRRSRKYPKRYATNYAVETEPGIQAVVTLLGDEVRYSRPPEGPTRAVLYVAHLSSDVELREEPLVKQLLEEEPGSELFACDVRGIGESRPDTCNPDSYFTPYGNDYFYAIHSFMLDDPYAAQRTRDILRVIDWLASTERTEIHLAAKGWGALPATFAAMLSEHVRQVTLKHALTSYAAIAESEEYKWPLSSLLPGVLRTFDLPDCYAALESKKLRQIEPWGAGGDVESAGG